MSMTHDSEDVAEDVDDASLTSVTNDVHDEEEEHHNEESMMTSPEMAIGIATHLSEESTAATELAMAHVTPHDSDNETVVAVRPQVEVPTTHTHEAETTMEAPSVKKILKFAIPAIGVWLCGPLLSLIDTSAVGLLSGTAQQAALNPAVAVTEYAALLIAFMYTATTNLIASAQEKDRSTRAKPLTSKNFIAALQLSGYVGAGLGAVLFGFAIPLLRTIIGNDAIDPQVFNAALEICQDTCSWNASCGHYW